MSVVLLGFAAGGCGGGQVAGQDATVPATQASAPPPVTTTATTATTPSAQSHRPRHTATTATTTQSTTTQPPANTTPTTTSFTTATVQTTPPAAKPAGTAIDETAQLVLVQKVSSTEYTQHGSVTGTYNGDMTLTAKITNRGIAVHFTVTTPEGTVTGHGLAIVRITGATLEPISGKATITSGTGRFDGVRGRGLDVKGRAALDGSRGNVHLTGTVFFP